MFDKPRANSQEQEPLFSSPPPNPALKGTRGYVLAPWRGFPAAPLSSVVGRKRRKSKGSSGGRVQGVIWPWLCWKGKHPFAPRDFLGFGCRSRCVGLFQPAGVPTRRGASRPALFAPLDLCPSFRLGRPLSFLARLAGEVSALSEAQPGAQGDAGLRFGLFSPSFVRPRPLASVVGGLVI